jgi:hypothetical protein
LKYQPHLKGAMVGQDMYGSIVDVLNIGNNPIPCVGILGIVHVQNMHDHPIDDLDLAIRLGVEGSGFGDLGAQQCPKARPKCVKELTILI